MTTRLESLKERRDKLEQQLTASNSATLRNVSPSNKDISVSSQLSATIRQINDLKSEEISNKWYGRDTSSSDEAPERSEGFFMKTLRGLQQPLNVIAGTTQSLLGKGSKPKLLDNIEEARRSGLTYGDILKQYDVPRAFQVPLGYALDITADPINWMTFGTGALIPRVGIGLVKGGMKSGAKGALTAAGKGLTSNLAKKTVTGMKPFTKFSTKFKGAAEKLGEKAVKGADEYNALIGKSLEADLKASRSAIPWLKSGTIGTKLEKGIRSIGKSKVTASEFEEGKNIGNRFANFMKYSPEEQARRMELDDITTNLSKEKGAIRKRDADFANYEELADPNAFIKMKDTAGAMVDVRIKDADNVILPKFKGKVSVEKNLENAEYLLNASKMDYNTQHLIDLHKVTPLGKTGVKFYDDFVDKLKNTTIKDLKNKRLGPMVLNDVIEDANNIVKFTEKLKKPIDLKPFKMMLETQEKLVSLFKSAKVAMNPGSFTVAFGGNFFMGAMMGLPVWKPSYLNSMWRAQKFLKGKTGAAGMRDILTADVGSLLSMAKKNPAKFEQALGISMEEISRKLGIEKRALVDLLSEKDSFKKVKEVMMKGLDASDEAAVTVANIGDEVGDAALMKRTSELTDISSDFNKKVSKDLGKYNTPAENVERNLVNNSVMRSEEGSGIVPGELVLGRNDYVDNLAKIINKSIDNNPEGYNLIAKFTGLLVEKMPRAYERIDQTFKLGTTNFLMTEGVNAKTLEILNRSVKITMDDLMPKSVIKGGERLYKLKADKATEVAVEAFMNYSAMPDFVRVMRALPVAGAPFLSFPYAMAAKTGKTALNNPAIFNKISFMLNEMNVGRTTQEKAAMENKYNKYLNSPTVAKMFGMWNINVKNFVPYYTMNMFNPSDRTYGNSNREKILKMTDKVPLFQDPAGQMLKDYIIQPWLLSGTDQIPQGQFGQPLYPAYDPKTGKQKDSSFLDIAPYAAKTLVEPLIPGFMGYAGLLAGKVPREILDHVPSYAFRNLANATQGRSTVGKDTKEDAVRKTLRSLFSRSGVPLYTLDATRTKIKN